MEDPQNEDPRIGDPFDPEEKCSHCGQTMFTKITFGKAEARMLYKAVRLCGFREVEFKVQVAEREDQWVKKKLDRCVLTEEFDHHSDYANVSRLSWWGFLERNEELWRNGIWLVLPKAVAFMRGDFPVPRHLLKWKGKDDICRSSSEQITFRQAADEDWLEIGEYMSRSFPSKFPDAGLPLFGNSA